MAQKFTTRESSMINITISEHHSTHLLQESLMIETHKALCLRISGSETRWQILSISKTNEMSMGRNLNSFNGIETKRIVLFCNNFVEKLEELVILNK